MTSKATQSSFTSGELTPAVHGRIDLEQYIRGLKTCRNMIVHPHGGASNRAGTEFICEVKDSTKAVRLIPFQFNTSDTYALEFGDQYMRVVRNGIQVEVSGVSAYSGATTYAQGDLAEYSGVNYYSKVDGNTGNQPDISPTQWHALTGDIYEIPTDYLEAELFDIKFVQSADIITIVHPNHAPMELSRSGHTAWKLTAITFAPSISAPTGMTSSHPGAGWKYCATAVAAETYEESLQSGDFDVTSRAATLSWTAVSGAIYYNIYFLWNGVYYWIGKTESTSWTDATLTPDYSITPPRARNPFNASGDYPATVGYHNQRLCFGGTNNDPQKIWMSRTGLFHNFTTSTPLRDDDAITLTIDSNQVNAIRHLISLTDLSVMSSGTEAIITANDNAFTFTNLRRKIQSYYGASSVAPIIAGKSALFVQENGNVLREISYDDAGNFGGSDRSIFSEHLFTGYSIPDMAYAKAPDSILWMVRNDGKLVGMTYLQEHGVHACHWHDTDGTFESVCAVPENNESAVYFVVKRKINGSWVRYIERLHSRAFDDVRDCFFVDSGLSYDSPATITGATQANPVVVTTSAAHGYSNGDKIDITDIVGMTELNGNRYTIANVASTTFELTDVDTGDNIDGTSYTAYESGGESRKAVSSVSGLSHLEGKIVSILADGSVMAQKTVASGAITLDYPASRIHIGLPYTSDLQTLKPPYKSIVGSKATASRLIIQVRDTRGLFAGQDANNLKEFKSIIEAYDTPISLVTGDMSINLTSDWTKGGSVYLRQSDPLPCTILSVIPDVSVGG